MEAKLVSGNPVMIDYTPASAVDAGEVVVIGDYPFVAHHDIAANKLGALAAMGGVYQVTPAAAVTGGKQVSWDDTANGVDESASGNAHFGQTMGASYDSDAHVDVLHNPQGVTGV